jgi:hypothetical protein
MLDTTVLKQQTQTEPSYVSVQETGPPAMALPDIYTAAIALPAAIENRPGHSVAKSCTPHPKVLPTLISVGSYVAHPRNVSIMAPP